MTQWIAPMTERCAKDSSKDGVADCFAPPFSSATEDNSKLLKADALVSD